VARRTAEKQATKGTAYQMKNPNLTASEFTVGLGLDHWVELFIVKDNA